MRRLKELVESCFRGKTPLQVTVDRVRRAVESYSASLDDVKQIVYSPFLNPLIDTSRQVGEEGVGELLKLVEGLDGGGKNG